MTTDKTKRFFRVSAEDFKKIPGSPIAYWVSEKLIMAFKGKNLADYAVCKSGIMTGSDNKFVRYWFEVLRGVKMIYFFRQ